MQPAFGPYRRTHQRGLLTVTSRLSVPAPLRLTTQALAVLGAAAMLAFTVQLAAADQNTVAAVKATDAVEPVAVGDSYTYTVTVDVGASPAGGITDLEITDGSIDYPQVSVDSASWEITGGATDDCTVSVTSDVDCNVGTVAANGEVVVTIAVTVDADVQVACTDPEAPGTLDATVLNRADVSWNDTDVVPPAGPWEIQSNAVNNSLDCDDWTAPPTVPDTTINSGPAQGSSTSSTSATFTFSGTNTTTGFECKLDAGAYAVCTSPKTYNSLTAASHTFSVRAMNAGGTDATPATRTWTVTGTTPPPASPFTDIGSSQFKNDINWLYNEGITGGCTATTFCPNANVTRDQMASFLSRALSLPATSLDFFTDDEGNIHEAAINRLAAAGITGGCAIGRFCPKDTVKRDQMASFLVRAYHLPASSTDPFTDDEGNQHENQINALAASDITGGCAANRYCPTASVTRGQMAAFLHRADPFKD